jgi:adenine-specific DNA methylase
MAEQTDARRLIEVAFPLKQASLDSVHEKNVRHGHISTLHIWPARRPLAACRAALIATLLPDPGTPEKRKNLLEKIGGKVVTDVQKKKVGGKTVEVVKERTEGGVLHWGNESSPDMDWFREEIRKAYSERAPRVLDPFAGGGAIPLEAMRLGCEATAIDINPVAWFVLKCTLEYPQKLVGHVRPLPRFAVESAEFMETFLKESGKLSKKQAEKELAQFQMGLFPPPEADLAWHVRAWGWWVLKQARKDLERFYPTINGKPTVAYLWARTVKCKNCRAVIPLLKTRWLCKRDTKRVLLTMEPNVDKTGLVFDVENDVPAIGSSPAQRRNYDRKVGLGTMSRSGSSCPLCSSILTWEDLRIAGQAQAFGSTMVAVVVDAKSGKEYRLPDESELTLAIESEKGVNALYELIPYGLPAENTPEPFGPRRHGAALRRYGMFRWADMFTARQLLALGDFVKHTLPVRNQLLAQGYSPEFAEAVAGYLSLACDRLVTYSSAVCSWASSRETIRSTFGRFAFPIVWDYAEVQTTSATSGAYTGAIEWICSFISHALDAYRFAPLPRVFNRSSMQQHTYKYDIILTDPPYYDAISYCDLMDFFHVWLRRVTHGLSSEIDGAFKEPLGPKWDHHSDDGELVDDPSRHGWDRARSKAIYEDGMYRSFEACHAALEPHGRFVVVFAHKYPDAWEALVSAIIRAGFVVDGSWPIQTEMGNRTRALSSSALSSSVWLVCKKRPESARPGWDNRVLEEMRQNIHARLRDYWDAGIRGPDFVWAATGPALEAYSKHPVIKKANEPGKLMEVADFLRHVRRLVVDFVVGRVLTGGDENSTSGLDDVTTYYILHRHDFGNDESAIGPCILYAISCNLSDRDLADRFEILLRTGGLASAEEDSETHESDEESDAEVEPEEGTGSTVKLRPWHQRKRKTMGYDTEGRPAPLVDQVHRLMHLWKLGDVSKVDDYLDSRGLRKNALFLHVLQALIELSRRDEQRDETVILENLSNHLQSRGVAATRPSYMTGFNPDPGQHGSDS